MTKQLTEEQKLTVLTLILNGYLPAARDYIDNIEKVAAAETAAKTHDTQETGGKAV